MPKINKILISGGGTGGHVFPAIAIADAFKKEFPEVEILFVGARDKLEMQKVPMAGYPIKGLWISGFHRKFTLKNLMFPVKLKISLIHSLWIVLTFKPDLAIGVGGFASGPILAVCRWLGIPFFLQEQNAYPGITNRLLKHKAQRIFVAYRQMESFFPKEKLILSGNPVRGVLRESLPSKVDARQFFDIPGKTKVVLIIGGSLGAASINKAVSQGLISHSQADEIFWIWQVGSLYYRELKSEPSLNKPNVLLLPFIDRMEMAYAASDLVVGRAGALTIAELAWINKPCILVPSPNVAADHQTANAKAMEQMGGGRWIPDEEAQEKLIPMAVSLVNDDQTLKGMVDRLSSNQHQDASSQIVKYVLEFLTKKKSNGGN
jgi:UDP-N-acetylglucosamine--N-acetylmuramyl-(pentapeptide) pyrophosphoryl-undecaprenol N-acetylglucosamine transferase